MTEEGQQTKITEPSELEVCQNQAEEYLNNWKRERADFINYKKDENKRMQEFMSFCNEALVVDILGILDDLYSANANSEDSSIAIIIRNFEQILINYGVEKIKVNGEAFNPLYHEAVKTEEGGENMSELRAGWIMNGKVIRPARVKISK